MTARALVIGAGAAGLSAAGRLRDAGLRVTVVDKARGVGGRMATRRLEGARIDSGAQFFTARSTTMRHLTDGWVAAGAAREWCRGFRRPPDGHPRYVGGAGMTSVPKLLAATLDVRTGVRLGALHLDGDGRYRPATAPAPGQATPDPDDAAIGGGFDAVVATPPVPQTLALLGAGGLAPAGPDRPTLDAIRYQPTLAALLVLGAPSALPDPGGVQLDPDGDGTFLTWVGDNRAKGISGVPAVTVHGAPGWSRQHFEDPEPAVLDEMVAAARPWIGPPPVVGGQLQRWRYATPLHLHHERCVTIRPPGAVGPLVCAGDAFGEARVEGAVLSGLAAADAVLAG